MERRLIAAFAFPLALSSCGGGGGGGGDGGAFGQSTPPSPPFISASLINFPASSTPTGFVNGVSVSVIDDDTGFPITTASATLNGVALLYNAANGDYEGNMTVAPGDPVTLKVVVNGSTYAVSGTQFSSLPAISTPPNGGAWSTNFKNMVGWSGGSPTANASYAIGLLDAADPNGNLLWPLTGQVDLEPIGTNTVAIPANALTSTGNRLVVVGLATILDIPNAAQDSTLVIGGFNYSPIEVTDTPVSLLSIAVTAPTPNQLPDHPTFAKGATQQVTATGTFLTTASSTINLDITASATWSSSDLAKATIDAHGLATGVGVGPVAFTATMDQVSGSTLQPTTGSILASVVAGFQTPTHTPGISPTMRLANTAIGDLDGDGRADVVALEEYPGSRVLLYHQTAQGALDSPQTITTDLKVRGVAIADVNGDGWADLIISGNSTTGAPGFLGRIAVFLQDSASHTLAGPQELTVSTDNVGMVAVADLNGDSRSDIVSVGAGSGGNGVISLFFQDSNGALGAEVPLTNFPVLLDGDSQLGDLHVADMNNDGLNDIVLQSDYTQLAVIKQGPAGTFASAPDFYTVQPSPWFRFETFALADLNGDGLTDVATSSVNGPLNIFYQNGGGTLTGPTKLPLLVGNEVHVADLDGDGLNDLVVSGGSAAGIAYQAPDHSFLNSLGYSFQTSSTGGTIVHQAMSIGDVTGDGLLDIVASWANEGVFVLPRAP